MTWVQKARSVVVLTVASYGTFAAVSIYKGSDRFYKDIIMPVVHKLDPERAHELAVFMAKHRFVPKNTYQDPKILRTEVFGKRLSNPIGIAAGFDKHGEAIMGLKDMGFGFVEIGSVTPKPQLGNDKPRVFRLSEDNAVINRYGFNSVGHNVVLQRLKELRHNQHISYPVGVNLGKNKTSTDPISDYVEGVKKFGPVSDYLVINVSSPNTPGLRNMQTKVALNALLRALVETQNELPQPNKPYLLLKLAPDLSYAERKEIAEVLATKACRIDGLIICNTTVDRPKFLQNKEKSETGGLSGQPLKEVSTKMISDMYNLTGGMFIIGVGGIFSGKDAYDKIRAGASVVQLYTGMIYEGPPIVSRVKKELAELLAADGFKNVSEAVGKSAKTKL